MQAFHEVHELHQDEAPDLDPQLVKSGRHEEMEYMVKKLQMFEFADEQQAWTRGGTRPTTTKWVEGPKVGEDGQMFVRCRLVAMGL